MQLNLQTRTASVLVSVHALNQSSSSQKILHSSDSRETPSNKTNNVYYRPIHGTFVYIFLPKWAIIRQHIILKYIRNNHSTTALYIQSNEIHNVVALVKCLLVLRCQLYMFRTVTVHPQELLCRYCVCRLWYVL